MLLRLLGIFKQKEDSRIPEKLSEEQKLVKGFADQSGQIWTLALKALQCLGKVKSGCPPQLGSLKGDPPHIKWLSRQNKDAAEVNLSVLYP